MRYRIVSVDNLSKNRKEWYAAFPNEEYGDYVIDVSMVFNSEEETERAVKERRIYKGKYLEYDKG